MKRPELRKLSTIVDKLWQLHQETDDLVAQEQIRAARGMLLVLWDTAKRACEATEGVKGRGYDPVLGATRRSVGKGRA